MKAGIGYWALHIIYKKLYGEKNNVNFERLLKRNLDIHLFNKTTLLIKLSSGVLFCPLVLLHKQPRLTCLVCFKRLYKWADKFEMDYGLTSLKKIEVKNGAKAGHGGDKKVHNFF